MKQHDKKLIRSFYEKGYKYRDDPERLLKADLAVIKIK